MIRPDGQPYHFAYVFERFPTFTQTFCLREVRELRAQGVRPFVFSIRDTSHESHCATAEDLQDCLHVLPAEKDLVTQVKRWKDARRFPQSVVLTLRHWGEKPDKMRVYEAAYIGLKLQEAGIAHAHSHFAGIGARTCWWIRHFYGITFSFTGHANDLFCAPENPDMPLATLMHDASTVITVSDYTAGWLREHFPKAKKKIRRVYNGLDLAPFIPLAEARESRAADAVPTLVSVGRLIEKKGYDDLIRACGVLRDQGLSFRCLIIGEGPLEEALAEQIAEANLTAQVSLCGALKFIDVLEVLADAAIFALACVTEKDGGKDNLPTVIMEAMAAGLPCVSTRLAGVPEMVIEGETGLLVDERQPDAFASALAELLVAPEKCHAMGQAGAERASRLFDKAKTAQSLLRSLVAGGLVARDEALIAQDGELAACYRRQRWLRLRKKLGLDRSRQSESSTTP